MEVAVRARRGGPRTPRFSRADPQAWAIGQRVRARRMELGMTQAQLADAAGLTKGSINATENSHYKGLPKGHTLAALSTALGVTMQFLWFGVEH